MTLLLLKGKTGHGKNRIREHGEVWRRKMLIDVGILSMSHKPENRWPIMSLKTGEWRWFDFDGDQDFEILVDESIELNGNS
jgi:hypothetical protein|tara:strand:- start:29 stop:271 length:243 start_codon:yes stop_codon:yes gene_type:complete